MSFQEKNIFIIASQGSSHLFQDRKEDICFFSQLLCTLTSPQRAVISILGKRVKEFLEGFSSNFLAFSIGKDQNYLPVHGGVTKFLYKLLHECYVYANCKVYIL